MPSRMTREAERQRRMQPVVLYWCITPSERFSRASHVGENRLTGILYGHL